MDQKEAKMFLPQITAFAEGKRIEYRKRGSKNNNDWKETFNPIFSMGLEYKVKPAPREFWAVCDSEDVGVCNHLFPVGEDGYGKAVNAAKGNPYARIIKLKEVRDGD